MTNLSNPVLDVIPRACKKRLWGFFLGSGALISVAPTTGHHHWVEGAGLRREVYGKAESKKIR
jgi:hypothetical protein